jgi:hypothetical protein
MDMTKTPAQLDREIKAHAKKKLVRVDVILINGAERAPSLGGGRRDVRASTDVYLTPKQIKLRTLVPLRVIDLDPGTVVAAIDDDIAQRAGHASQLRAERGLDRE